MRIIDADTLKTDLKRFYENEVTARQLIDEQATVEAIPIEWLNQKYAENDPDGGNEEFDRYLWDSICYVLTAWKEEREEEE